jgi:hypothetical protein
MLDKKKSALLGPMVAIILLATASPALAADTTVTFTVTAGDLTITAPTEQDLGSAPPGGSVSASLGPVTVTDTRGATPATWTATVTTTDFTTGGGTAAETIGKASVTYWSGPATSSTPAAGFTPGQPTVGDAVTLDVSRTAFSFSGAGGNTATWNPTLSVAIPVTSLAGFYSGTVTHSVAP